MPVTDLAAALGLRFPIFLAPMAGDAARPELVAAVSDAGGLGQLGGGYLAPEALRASIHAIRRHTDRPFGVNLFVPERPATDAQQVEVFRNLLARYYAELGLAPPVVVATPEAPFEQQLEVVIEERVPVFSFTFGIPPKVLLERLHDAGIFIMGTATSVAEALALQAAGVDAVVAQGWEAGGHRGGFLPPSDAGLLGTMALVPQVVDAVSVPVVAAGGIADRRGVRAAFALGARAAAAGTAFLATDEAALSPAYRAALNGPCATVTRLTRVFSGKLARAVPNRFMDDMERRAAAIPPYPLTHHLTRALRAEAARRSDADYLSLWAGQCALLARSGSARKVLQELAAGVSDAF